jgi:hypothetical protein
MSRRLTVSQIKSTPLRRAAVVVAFVPILVISVVCYSLVTAGEAWSDLWSAAVEAWRGARDE